MDLMANWPCPSTISALTTTRLLGVSQQPYTSNNLALHVGDKHEDVLANRLVLRQRLHLPQEPEWLEQTHSNHCVIVEQTQERSADAAITQDKSKVLAIMTADCLPIALCNQQGTEIAAIHAGWRGLLNGVIDNTLAKMTSDLADCMAWIGPAICKDCYQTGSEVYNEFHAHYSLSEHTFFKQQDIWHADLAKIAEEILYASGVNAVYQSGACSFENKNQFYSYRRDAQTGRMATLIWFSSN